MIMDGVLDHRHSSVVYRLGASLFETRTLRSLLYLTFFLIPLSMETELPGGLSTDLFGEPMLWVLTGLCIWMMCLRGVPRTLMSSLSLIIVLHLLWIVVSGVMAVYPVYSIKYALAKSWYILPLYVLPHFLLSSQEQLRTLLKCFLVGLLIAATYFFYHHWQEGFSYLGRANVGSPIWRNHVNYACALVLSLPMIYYLYRTSRSGHGLYYLLWAGCHLYMLQFAYARISYLCIAAMIGYYVVLRLRLTIPVLITAGLLTVGAVLWLQDDRHYLDLAPEYDRTIMQRDFGSKISATAKGQDISSMERVHRWVAGANMIADRPVYGMGPANFYFTYRPYTVYSFETYVSDNPEQSGIHSYFLMILVEQGWIGLGLWLLLLIVALTQIERRYHAAESVTHQHLYLYIGLTLSAVLTMNLVNDLIEVIKVGGVFFLVMTLIGRADHLSEQETE